MSYEIKRVFILGAGSSRGASYLQHDRTRPPSFLDADFLQIACRYEPDLTVPLLHYLHRYAPGLRGLSTSMETLYTHLEAADMAWNQFIRQAGRLADDYDRARKMFFEIVVKLLERSHAGRTCANHANLFAKCVAGDVIVTFNYDLVAETALAKAIGWSASRQTYGLSGKAGAMEKQVTVLKLHGSLNFRRRARAVKLLTGTGKTIYKATHALGIVPPTWNKQDAIATALGSLWRKAGLAIRYAREITVVGFSMNPTDILASTLIQQGLQSNQAIERLTVVDKSSDIRARWLDLMARIHWDDTNAHPVVELSDSLESHTALP